MLYIMLHAVLYRGWFDPDDTRRIEYCSKISECLEIYKKNSYGKNNFAGVQRKFVRMSFFPVKEKTGTLKIIYLYFLYRNSPSNSVPELLEEMFPC